VNAKGQKVMESIIDYDGGAASQGFKISSLNAAGIYYLLVVNEKVKLSQPILIK
jgi:hypothetical protein